MTHRRTTLRNLIVMAVTGIARYGGNVKATRLDPVERGALPAATVTTLDETSALDHQIDEDDLSLRRAVRFQVIAAVEAGSDPDTLLDTMAEEIEMAIAGNASIDAACRSFNLDSSRFDVTGASSGDAAVSIPVARLELIWTLIYLTPTKDPSGTA